MSFVVLMIALIPLSYLFTTSVIQAGQSENQQTALSIAEKWTETLQRDAAGQQQRRGHRRPGCGAGRAAAGSTTTTASYSVQPASTLTPTTINVAATSTLRHRHCHLPDRAPA